MALCLHKQVASATSKELRVSCHINARLVLANSYIEQVLLQTHFTHYEAYASLCLGSSKRHRFLSIDRHNACAAAAAAAAATAVALQQQQQRRLAIGAASKGSLEW